MQGKTSKKISSKINNLIQTCVGPEQKPIRLPYTKEKAFQAEVNNCHINNMVKCKYHGGDIVFGWVIWEIRTTNFVEAEFHSVWRSPVGKLIDITPRKNQNKEVLFVRDAVRIVEKISYKEQAALKTFDNIRFMQGVQLTGATTVIGLIDSPLAIGEGLVNSKQIS